MMRKLEKYTRAELVEALECLRQAPDAADELAQTVHELQVHQFEVEIQNLELREAQTELELSRDRYADLFDYAPVGYATFGRAGLVREINLTGAAMLGEERSRIVGHPFRRHVSEEDRRRFDEHLRVANGEERRAVTELTLAGARREPMDVRLETVRLGVEPADPRLRTVLIDMSDERRAERAEASRERFQQLSVHLLRAREEERARAAQEVHDNLGQLVTALRFELEWLAAPRRRAGRIQRERLAAAIGLTDQLLGDIRRIATTLRPMMLDHLGLADALRWQIEEFSKRGGTPVDLRVDLPALDPDFERDTAVFRVLQEALTNIARHSGATRVAVRLSLDGDRSLKLLVEDDGCGIQNERLADPTSLGLTGMRERAAALGGELSVDGAPNGGTRVSLAVPL